MTEQDVLCGHVAIVAALQAGWRVVQLTAAGAGGTQYSPGPVYLYALMEREIPDDDLDSDDSGQKPGAE